MAANNWMLLSYNCSNKKINIQADFVKPEELIKEARLKFPQVSNNSISLQVYDREVEDFIDVENGDEVPARSKVKVIVEAATDSISNSIQEPLPCGPIALTGGTAKLTSTDFSQSASHAQHSLTSAWLTNYKVPTFPDALTAKIQSGNTSAGSDSAVLDILFESVKPYTLYPTPCQYSEIVNKLLSKYPKLSSELDLTNQKQLWVTKLKYKFQNSRRRDETLRASLEVVQRKRKQPPTQNLAKTAKEQVTKYPPIFGMPNYLPAREASEDDKSIEAHKKWLQTEGTKKRPNYDEVEARMTLTFSERRNAVIKENMPIDQLKEQYPWLFKDDGIELLADFRRINGGSAGALKLLTKGLEKYARPLLFCYKRQTKLKKDDDLLSFINEIEKLADEKVRKDAEAKAAIVALPALLGETNNMFRYQEDGENTGPAVLVRTDEISPVHSRQFSLFVDGTLVCKVGDLLTAAACYLSSYYVFHLQYESSVQRTLEFCQIALLQVKDKCPTNKHVLTLISRLNRKIP